MSEVNRVERVALNKRTSRRVSIGVDPTIPVATARRNCVWNDREYEKGAVVVCEEVTYVCVTGYWQELEDDQQGN